MKVGYTKRLFPYHNIFCSFMRSQLGLRQKTIPDAISVVAPINHAGRIQPIVDFCSLFAVGLGVDYEETRILGIMTGKGDNIPNHCHDEEDAVLYYASGKSPLLVEGQSEVMIRPGVLVFLEAGEFHSVPTELEDRYVLGVLFK